MLRRRLPADAAAEPAGPRQPAGGAAAGGRLAAAALQALSPGHRQVSLLALRPSVRAGARRAGKPLQEPVRGGAGRLPARYERLRIPLAGDVELHPLPRRDGAVRANGRRGAAERHRRSGAPPRGGIQGLVSASVRNRKNTYDR